MTSPRRRWFQFRLRTLLVLVVVLCLPLSWLAVELQRARRQYLVVQALRSHGATVHYDTRVSTRPRPFSLRRLLGDDFFCHVDCVEFDSESDKRPRLELLRDLPYVRSVFLTGTPVTDADLKHLQGLKKIEYLVLSDCPRITDAGLEHLALLTSLWAVDVSGTQVTERGVQRLQRVFPGSCIPR